MFGLEVPALVGPDKALADQVKELLRPWLRWAMSWRGCTPPRRCYIIMCFEITRWCGCCRGGASVSFGVGTRQT